jgi:hypothetical protein
MTKNGTEMQRSAALAILVVLDKSAALAPAQEEYSDPKSGDWLRLDSLQVLLLAESPNQAIPLAVSAVADKTARKAAVPYLAFGADSIRELRGSIYLNVSQSSEIDFNQPAQPIIVDAPPGLDTAANGASLKDLSADDEAQLGLAADYLRALIGDRGGLPQLIDAARASNWKDDQLTRLTYRAIAKINDDSQTPVLAEIYHSYTADSYEIREFYWTIRSMSGPNILALRKKIRDEVGMARLE